MILHAADVEERLGTAFQEVQNLLLVKKDPKLSMALDLWKEQEKDFSARVDQ